MQTLSYGYLLPETGDAGSEWFPAIESNIQRLNDHDHKGVDSVKLDSESFELISDSIIPSDWAAYGGIYRALVTMPGSLEFDTTAIQFRTSDQDLYPSYEKITDNTFYVYSNDSSLTVEVLYA